MLECKGHLWTRGSFGAVLRQISMAMPLFIRHAWTPQLCYMPCLSTLCQTGLAVERAKYALPRVPPRQASVVLMPNSSALVVSSYRRRLPAPEVYLQLP